jgi:hypothetical protein
MSKEIFPPDPNVLMIGHKYNDLLNEYKNTIIESLNKFKYCNINAPMAVTNDLEKWINDFNKRFVEQGTKYRYHVTRNGPYLKIIVGEQTKQWWFNNR